MGCWADGKVKETLVSVPALLVRICCIRSRESVAIGNARNVNSFSGQEVNIELDHLKGILDKEAVSRHGSWHCNVGSHIHEPSQDMPPASVQLISKCLSKGALPMTRG